MGFIDWVKGIFGLGDYYDDEFDDYYDDEEEDGDEAVEVEDDYPRLRSQYRSPYAERSPGVTRVDRDSDFDGARRAASGLSVGTSPGAGPRVQMHIVEPMSYSEAQHIADKFKSGVPVIMNLGMTSPDVSKRLVDFASGLTYGRGGGLQKVSDKVLMLTPKNVEVSAEDRARLRDEGLFTFEVP